MTSSSGIDLRDTDTLLPGSAKLSSDPGRDGARIIKSVSAPGTGFGQWHHNSLALQYDILYREI